MIPTTMQEVLREAAGNVLTDDEIKALAQHILQSDYMAARDEWVRDQWSDQHERRAPLQQ